MNKYDIVKQIECFAPLNTQEGWDCSGWIIEASDIVEVNKIMLCLTVTENVILQAQKADCDLIISHHPCFFVPIGWHGINIYCAHTNLDKAKGGTTDRIILKLGLEGNKINYEHDFVRIVEYKTTVEEFNNRLKTISPNARIVNNFGVKELNRIAFCAGSGVDFIDEITVDCYVTADVKYHAAMDSNVVLYDIGHYESEILVLPVFEEIVKSIGEDIEIIYAEEKSPFSQI